MGKCLVREQTLSPQDMLALRLLSLFLLIVPNTYQVQTTMGQAHIA